MADTNYALFLVLENGRSYSAMNGCNLPQHIEVMNLLKGLKDCGLLIKVKDIKIDKTK